VVLPLVQIHLDTFTVSDGLHYVAAYASAGLSEDAMVPTKESSIQLLDGVDAALTNSSLHSRPSTVVDTL
jgi:hypothetical protein